MDKCAIGLGLVYTAKRSREDAREDSGWGLEDADFFGRQAAPLTAICVSDKARDKPRGSRIFETKIDTPL